MNIRQFILLIGIILWSQNVITAQYFGRNKPHYQSFDFKVKETPNFNIYYYLKNKNAVEQIAQMTEQWYDLHLEITNTPFTEKNPILFYNNHAEFQQTNAISGIIGVGTGGVTESLKNRVVMPLTFTTQQTNQVLGHELVHAFQFDMIINGDSTSMRSLANLPLWIVEGMAEYMSIGRHDAFTSMWMRDAILNEDVPSFKEMYHPKYFPYRYGQAAWSFLTGFYGDEIIKPLFMETAKFGLPIATKTVLGESMENVSTNWQNALETHFRPFLGNGKENFIGRKLLSEENSGKINVSPSLSPNGKYVVFLSEKDLFSTDLFIAEAKSGKIINKMASLVKDGDLDNFNYLESSGTWSPDSKQFAFIGFQKGINVIVIKDALSTKTIQTIKLKNVPSLAGPVWSKDGKSMVVSGLVQGQTDLYEINIKSGRVRQLTDDVYAEIHANFSVDGKKLVFSYDKNSIEAGRTFGKYTFDLAVMDYETREIEILDAFEKVDNLNPNFDHLGNIYFISEHGGFRNMYRYLSATGEVHQMTDLLTGLSGISRYSPAISVSTKMDRVLFTHYYDQKHSIYQSKSNRLLNKTIETDSFDFAAGILPVTGLEKSDIVNQNLSNIDNKAYADAEDFKNKKYKSKFRLDYVGGGAGVGVNNSTFGTYSGLQGGIDLLFSDILGNQQLFTQLAINGDFKDFGGQLAYLNRKHKVAWGVGLSHVPQLSGFRDQPFRDVVMDNSGNDIDVIVDRINLLRVYDQGLNVFSHIPFSTTLRLEGGVGVNRRSFRWDQVDNYYDSSGSFLIGQQENKIPVPDTLAFNRYFSLVKGNSASANIAIVGDNSYFGITSPLQGQRYRLQVERSLGINDYYGILGDYRKYIWKKPVSFAFRGMSYLRFENDVSSLYPFYLGTMGFVRGYDFVFDQGLNNPGDVDLGQLLGSKMAMANFEIRLPFTGPKQLSLIGSKYLFTDLAFFFDAGVAFDEFAHLSDGKLTVLSNGTQVLVKPEFAMSAGVSMRINLFGALILEPYFAWPIQKDTKMQFGLNFVPGW